MTSPSTRLLRILLAGSALAAGMLAVDLLSTHDSAAASDLVPDLIPDTVTSITEPLAPVVTTVVTPVVDVVATASAPVVAPVASTLTPVIAPIAAPVISSVVVPLEPVVTALTEPLAPVAHAAIDPFLPAIAPLIPVVAPLVTVVEPLASVVVIVDAVDVLPGLPLAAVTPNTTLLGGGLVLLSGAVGASVIQLLPLQGNSPSPRQAPQAPTGSTSPVLFADLAFAYPVSAASALTALPATEVIPASPTFASDTTPD
jgi:hypothetical protein